MNISKINRQLGEALNWQPFAKGTSNQLYRAVERPEWVLRINAPPSNAFGVLREREAEVLEAIQGSSWALKVLENKPDSGWCLMAYHGAPLEALSDQLTAQLLQAITQYQQLAIKPDAEFDYGYLLASYRAILQQPQALALLDALEKALNSLPELALCLVHHDLHLGNLALDGQQLVILDWEYAGWGSAWFDAAALSQSFAIAPEVIAKLPAFQALDLALFNQGLAIAEHVIASLALLWEWARGVSAPELIDSSLIQRSEQQLAVLALEQ